MNNDYFNYKKCVDDLTTILSIGYYFEYSFKVIEKRIVKSDYFSSFNKDYLMPEDYKDEETLIKEIYKDIGIAERPNELSYKEFEWVSMLYMNIIKNTAFNFETIFCYIPIKDAVAMYDVYHELDINKSYMYFIEQREKHSIISLKMKSIGLTNNEVAKECNLSSSMIDALRNRRRDIKKLDIEHALKLANVLCIDPRTLLNN